MQLFRYHPVNAAWPNKFLPSYLDNVTLKAREANSQRNKICVKRFELQNRSGSAANVGFGGRLKNDASLWKAGQYSAAGTSYTDDTTDAQNATANDFALTTLTNNDGFIVLSQIPFNILSIVVGTAQNGGVPVYDLAYSVAGGIWTAIALADLHTTAISFTAGEQVIWWDIPTDWAVTEAGHATGITTGYYGIRVRATTAPTITAALANLIVPGVIMSSVDTLADDGVKVWDYGSSELELPPQCDALAAAMTVAGKQSQISALMRFAG